MTTLRQFILLIAYIMYFPFILVAFPFGMLAAAIHAGWVNGYRYLVHGGWK